MQEQRITIVTGHYGAGKTNFAVNLAVEAAAGGRKTTLYDLDIVNPYFRSADFTPMLRELGVEVAAPEAANTNLDLPALNGRLEGALRVGSPDLILDVGGDDAGAIALGRFAPLLQTRSYTFLYVVNRFRYMTRTPEEAVQLLREIEAASRLYATGIVNNSNLGPATTPADLYDGQIYADAVSALTGLPLVCTCVPRGLEADVPNRRDVEVYVKLPF